MADQTATASAKETTASASAKTGSKVVRYKTRRGASHREITLEQFKSVGIEVPFTDLTQTTVSWNPSNGHKVPSSVFSAAGLARALKEDDLEEVEA